METVADDLTSKLQAVLKQKSSFGAAEQDGAASTPVGPVQSVESWASVYGFELPRDEHVGLLLIQGRSRLSIAKEIGVSPPTIYRLVQTPTFAKAFRAMQAELRESALGQKARIELLCTTAIDNIADILFNSTDPDLKTKTSFALLDRGGHSVKHEAEITQKLEIDTDAAELITRSLKELKMASKEKPAEVLDI